MQKGIFENLKPSLQLLLLFITIGVSMVIIYLIGMAIFMIFTGVDNSLLALSSTSSLRYLQIVQSIGVFIVPPLIVAFFVSKSLFKWLGFEKPKLIMIFFTLALILVCQPMISFLTELNMSMDFPQFLKSWEVKIRMQEDVNNNLLFRLLDTNQPVTILLNAFIIVILAAFGEEMLFRGTIQPLLGKIFKNSHLAVLTTAFLFSFIHFQFLTFLPRFILGVLMGYLFVFTKNLWYPITAHFFNNLMSFLVFYYYRYTQPEINPFQTEGEKFGTLMIILSFVTVGVVGWIFFKFRKRDS
ncbi:MAG: CPBP family intramembrane metalloprotease [Marinilabiliaceae bacterium]|nr:CPBP family intramembrane metalloprotease [Marinilabiliaceae bacterium]